MTTDDWVKLKIGNDWAHRFLALTVTNDRRGGLRCVPGELVLVRFPDGSEKELPIQMLRIDDSYSDHGHAQDVTSYVPAVVLSACGVPVHISLDKLEVSRAWAEAHGAK